MARDSRPLAQRFKAFAVRAGLPVEDDPAKQTTSPETAPANEADPVPSAEGQPHPQAAADTPDDEQPTGEFPAIDPDTATAPAAGSVPVEPSAAREDDQPTDANPVVTPDWMDPPATDPIPLPPSTELGAASAPQPADPSDRSVDWSSPADDVIEPLGPSGDASDVSPYLPVEPSPEEPADAFGPSTGIQAAWAAEAEAEDTASSTPLPIWDTTPSAPVDAPKDAHDTTVPAWEAEAEAEEPSGLVVPPPLHAYDAPAAPEPSPPSDGPTLSPPVLPKRVEPTEPEPADTAADPNGPAAPTEPEPVETAADPNGPAAPTERFALQPPSDEALAAVPDEREPEWTPTALHEALSLDEDEPATVAQDVPTSTPDAQATGSADTDATEDSPERETDAAAPAPEPAAKRGLLGGFGRRKRSASTSDETPPPTPSEATPESVDAVVPEPAESLVPEPVVAHDHGTSEPEPEPEPIEAQASRDDDAEAPAADPGSITSRFAAIGRRALSRKEAKAAAAAVAAVNAPDEPEPAPAPEPEPEFVPGDYKPSFAERAALRRRVKSLRARRDAGLAELGAIVLDQSRFGDPTGGTLVRRRTTVLADLDGEIAAIEAALDEGSATEAVTQLGAVHCASCDALVGPADRFCATCGTARPSAEADGSQNAA